MSCLLLNIKNLQSPSENVLLLYAQTSMIMVGIRNPGKEQRTMAKSANLYARIEPDLKEQAETILSALGIPASNAITMFYRQVVLQKGLPFEVRLPTAQPVDISAITEEQLSAELEKGYADITAGRTRSVKSVFDDIRKDYGV